MLTREQKEKMYGFPMPNEVKGAKFQMLDWVYYIDIQMFHASVYSGEVVRIEQSNMINFAFQYGITFGYDVVRRNESEIFCSLSEAQEEANRLNEKMKNDRESFLANLPRLTASVNYAKQTNLINEF